MLLFLANLFCYSYEFEWVDKQIKLKKFHSQKHFKVCCRYIDDLFLLNSFDTFDSLTVPYLDLLLSVKNGVTTALVFDKRDAFNFPIVNFPTLTGNIPLKISYGVFVCELVRYARVLPNFTLKLNPGCIAVTRWEIPYRYLFFQISV